MPTLLLILILAGREQPLQSYRYVQTTHTAAVNGVAIPVAQLPSMRYYEGRLDLSRDYIFRDHMETHR